MPILRPLIGMDKLEITERGQAARHLRDLDRARRRLLHLFTPAHPFTRMRPDEVRAAESRLEVERLVAAGVEGATVETFEFPRRRCPGPPPALGVSPAPRM